jgi:DNA replication protein DnaC
MNKQCEKMLKYLKWGHLHEHWDEIIAQAEKGHWSYERFLQENIQKEFERRVEVATTGRIYRAKIPNSFTIETYPFEEQPHLDTKRLLQRYDSLDYLEKKQNLIFIGPTGTGKSGLASSILRHALQNGHSGRFVEFSTLMEELVSSIADHSSKKLIKRYCSYNCLVIDDLCSIGVEKTEIGLFYSLLQKRHTKSCTIITTALGFKEWDSIFNSKQMTDALIGRLSDNGHIINLKKCKSIRQAPDVD